jgi:signal transduction histidine kinase
VNPNGIKRAILVPLVIALAGLAVAFAIMLSMSRERLYERDLDHSVRTFETQFNARLENAGRTMEAALAAALADHRINGAFAVRDRRALFAAAEPLYRRLSVDHRISRFYFFDGDGRVFLRVHQPEMLGDFPDRATLRRTRESETPTRGIELGPLGNLTLRLVTPWRDRGAIRGYVEMGIEVEDLIGDLKTQPGIDSLLFVYKDVVDKAAWEESRGGPGRESQWDRFRTMVQVGGEANPLPAGLATVLNALKPGMQIGNTGAQLEEDGRLLLAALLPIPDLSGWEVGRVVVTTDATPLRQEFLRDLAGIVGAIAIVGIVLVTAFHWLLDRVQRRLAQTEARLVETARAAQAASEAKTMFLATMSHELRTPLNAIIGFSEIMKGQMLGPLENEAYKGYVADIHRSGTDLLKLINDILDIARLEGGHIELRPQRLAPGEIAESCLRSVAGRARREGISLVHDLPSGLPAVLADELRLKQVLLNLLTNAIKFTPVGGTVDLSLAEGNGMLSFRVADTGIGMKPEDIPKVLDPFVQLADQMTRDHDGAGLGLPLTKSLVELHGGRLEIQSQPGRGTVATALFPLAGTAPEALAAQ